MGLYKVYFALQKELLILFWLENLEKKLLLKN